MNKRHTNNNNLKAQDLRYRSPKKIELTEPKHINIPKGGTTYNPLISVAAWSKKTSAVGEIFSKVHQIDGLNQKLQRQIGLPLSAHIKLIHIDTKSAVIVANSGVWASRVRYIRDDILRILCQYTGDEINELSIRNRIS